MTRAHLYVTDAEIAARLGVECRFWQEIVRQLEMKGLPTANPLFGGRRYWPAVQTFFDRYELDRHNGLIGKGKEEPFHERRKAAGR